MIDLRRSGRSPRFAAPVVAAVVFWLVVQNTLLLIDPGQFSAVPFVVARALLRVTAALAERYPLVIGLLVLNLAVAVWLGVAPWRRPTPERKEDLS